MKPAFSSDNQKPVYDRDGSIISSAKIEPDGSVTSNFSIIGLDNITAITKTSNADCYKDNIASFKKDGIYIVSEIEGIDKKDIYTIGDASNDKGMLLEFNGYKMPYSYPEIIFSRARLTSSVKNLIRKIIKLCPKF